MLARVPSEIRTQMRKGIDAVALKRAAAAEAQKAKLVGETFADLTARYLESAARPKLNRQPAVST